MKRSMWLALALVCHCWLVQQCRGRDTPTRSVSEARADAVLAYASGWFSAAVQANNATPAKSDAKPAAKHPANKLAGETSPYLLMHAHNPVQWYPWGEEALSKAKKEKKPIFLSIGYSSCYWCHVMERESFLDDEIAKFLNEHFVCIKVDREERPDIDEIYMTALHTLGRPGGWPLSMFLTPDARPFFGGTYYPPRDRPESGHTGFLTVIKKLVEMREKEAAKIDELATRLTEAVKQNLAEPRAAQLIKLTPDMVKQAQADLAKVYDDENGGFAYGQTKFPNPPNLVFLLGQARAGDAGAKKMFVHTLEKMATSGLRDHLGGGFHRYTVDRRWRVPHFEKMLYDNGQLASLYAEGFVLTGDSEFRRVVEELAQFILRELTDKQGGFYAALDAETDAVEGKFYIWTRDEIRQALQKAEYDLFAPIYGVADEPNFEETHYVLQLARPLAVVAKERGQSAQQLAAQLAPIRAKLLAVRDKRKRPLTDTKILTGWNGLMIRGLADAGRCLKNPQYTAAAERAADFVLNNLRRDGRLLRTYTSGQAKLNGYLEDYVLLADGLIALHAATGSRRWLDTADDLTRKQIELYWDERNGGFYFTSSDHEQLIARRKDAFDGPIPAGNSVAAENLLTLAAALEKPDHRTRAEKTLQALAPRLSQSPASVPRAAHALFLLHHGGTEARRDPKSK
jgi:uncharacterized protein YyaL (SSP411 family)